MNLNRLYIILSILEATTSFILFDIRFFIISNIIFKSLSSVDIIKNSLSSIISSKELIVQELD